MIDLVKYIIEHGENIAALAGVIGGLFLLLKGVNEFTENRKLKRVEFLERLMTEFYDNKNRNAIDLLDDFVVVVNDSTFHSSTLETTLRDHHHSQIIVVNDEVVIRNAFDNLLEFFMKIEYLWYNKLISKSEIRQFEYYLAKIKDSKAVRQYITAYYNERRFENLFKILINE